MIDLITKGTQEVLIDFIAFVECHRVFPKKSQSIEASLHLDHRIDLNKAKFDR